MIGRGFGQRPLRSAPRSERAASGGSAGRVSCFSGVPTEQGASFVVN